MKRLLFLSIVLTLILAACAPAGDASDPNDLPVSYPDGSYPNSDQNPPAQPADDYIPRPEDAALTRGTAHLDSTDLLTLESYPPQFMLQLKGSLPTPCHALRVAVSPPDAQNQVMVDVYSVSDPATVCAQVLSPFEVNIPLGSFPTGTYTLWINGEKAAEFQS
ncbi:MAG: hypothetical protein DPW18_15995 [Chloroflexi bacterium]|nr:hypothetical protein [Chloroflexota bacterium]MDL1944610.1 hypothetical protein [Chloroflexi bacterium CFX2]